jgi:ribosomal protein L13E
MNVSPMSAKTVGCPSLEEPAEQHRNIVAGRGFQLGPVTTGGSTATTPPRVTIHSRRRCNNSSRREALDKW